MKKNFLILMILLAMVGGWTAVSHFSKPKVTTQESAPDFDYKTWQEQTGHFKDFSGKAVLLHFWATWCAPCLEEFPDLIQLAKSREDFTLMAVAVGDTKQAIESFLKNKIGTTPDNVIIVMDSNKIISKNTYGVNQFPETFLISHDMKIVRRIKGAHPSWNSDKVHNEIKVLNGE